MKGGYQVQSRLATHLDEIRMEAMVAGPSRSRRERDRAFDEIQRLALETKRPIARQKALAWLDAYQALVAAGVPDLEARGLATVVWECRACLYFSRGAIMTPEDIEFTAPSSEA